MGARPFPSILTNGAGPSASFMERKWEAEKWEILSHEGPFDRVQLDRRSLIGTVRIYMYYFRRHICIYSRECSKYVSRARARRVQRVGKHVVLVYVRRMFPHRIIPPQLWYGQKHWQDTAASSVPFSLVPLPIFHSLFPPLLSLWFAWIVYESFQTDCLLSQATEQPVSLEILGPSRQMSPLCPSVNHTYLF